ncbi:MlaD family protein [Sulfuricurvum sp.]|uniref:MlaD family protein n=2 Tax=Sulfuricurvum sp. TaxID=2025608 RepID=UPI002624C89B|nr:MlaD family protein [Sulfuricurvum sp.]MDD4885157.1 MlaD family protein [Sulfuricurvum sp.]
MESKVNYTAVGIFVLLLGSALIAFAFWLGKYNQDEGNYHRFRVYITESISGLSPEAAVKFHGVDVGMVESIRINPKNSEEVELTLKIHKDTPIKTDSTAVLKFYGITGLAFIEIVGGSKDAPLLKTAKNNIAIIPSSPSLIKRLDESLSNVAFKLSNALDHADRLFSEQNIENVAQTLEHLRSLSTQIDGYQAQIRLLLQQTSQLENNASESLYAMKNAADSVKNSSDKFNLMMQTKMNAALDSLNTASRESHTLIRKIEESLERGDYNLNAIASPAASELGDLMRQTQTLSNEMEMTLQNLRESPSDLLFKQSTPKPGPGE